MIADQNKEQIAMKKIIIWLATILMLYTPVFADFTLSKPQNAVFGVGIVGEPVIITTSNVTLDLSNNTIIGGSNGIIIEPFLHNITIKNGIISNITGTGILVNEGCSNIVISNIITNSCDEAAIYFAGSAQNPITDSLIDQCISVSCCQQSTALNPTAIVLTHCQETVVSNCLLTYNFNLQKSITGIVFDHCFSSNLLNVTVREHIGGTGAVAFQISSSQSNTFSNCQAISNFVNSLIPGSFSYGFLISGTDCGAMGIINCTVLQQTGGDQSAGFILNQGAHNMLLQNCQSINNVGITDSYGFLLTDTITGVSIINCFAKDNQTSDIITGTFAAGFLLDSANGCQLIDCNADHQKSSTAVGFDIRTATRCTFNNCLATHNTGASNSQSFGFRMNQGGALDAGGNILVLNQALDNGNIADNQMNNFIPGSFVNTNFASLNTVLFPFTNLGLIPAIPV